MLAKVVIRFLVCVVLIGLVGGCVGESELPAVLQPPYWPDTQWPTSIPEEQGIDSALVVDMLQEVQQEDLNVHSLLVIRHGYLVTEVYFPPYTQDIKHPVRSITKGVTSAVIGIAIDEGYIDCVHQGVLDFFPEIAQETRDDYLAELTIEHLLTMTAGFNTSTLPNFAGRDSGFDVVEYILTHSSIISEPGEAFYYDSGLPHVLSAIIQKTTGLTLEAYVREKLFSPLGITDYSWQSDPQGITTGYSGLSIRPRDMAKLGYLYLHNGQWDGEHIVPAEWVEASTTRHVVTEGLMNAAEDDGYGYYWWVDSFGGYSAHGHGGQYVFVIPGLDMVVVFTGSFPDPDFPTPHRLLRTYLLPAAESAQPLPDNPQAFNQLSEMIESIQESERPAAPLPEIARQVTGTTYRITGDAAVDWPETITFNFAENDTYVSEFGVHGETTALTGGLNNVFYMNILGQEGEIIATLRGYWKDDWTFVEEQNLDLYSEIQFYTITYTFEDSKLYITVESSMGYFSSLQAVGEAVE